VNGLLAVSPSPQASRRQAGTGEPATVQPGEQPLNDLSRGGAQGEGAMKRASSDESAVGAQFIALAPANPPAVEEPSETYDGVEAVAGHAIRENSEPYGDGEEFSETQGTERRGPALSPSPSQGGGSWGVGDSSAVPPVAARLLAEILALDLGNLTPIRALTLLHELQTSAREAVPWSDWMASMAGARGTPERE
jgi:hypothetical protein